ncbi:MotE family protein [Roseivivax sp. CAU 1761]
MIRPSRSQLLFGALACAGILRLGVGLGEGADAVRGSVFVGPAQAAGAAAEPEPAAPAPDVGQAADEILAKGCEMPEALLSAIKRERELLAAQKEKLEARASEIDLAAAELAIEKDRLGALQAELAALLERVAAHQTADVDRLVALYSAMKPGEAARIMDDLDLETTVMVLGTMRERDAAPIMAQLSPVRARAISKIILERSQLPGDQDLTGLRIK